MYRHCISCSTDLGRNESVEHFQTGRTLAFDAWKGRLWAVCPRCARWNLAPMEERWEAVEEAEKLFVDSRLRVHSENVGLARLPDRTRLIRVGEALPGELAAWRYGDHMVKRRWRIWIGAGATVLGSGALIFGGIPLLAAAGVAGAPAMAAGMALQLAGNWTLVRNEFRTVLKLPASRSPTGEDLTLRLQQARLARVVTGESGSVAVEIPSPLPPRREQVGGVVRWVPADDLRLEGDVAHRLLGRTLVSANAWGLSAGRVGRAVERLTAAGGPEAFLRQVGATPAGVFPAWQSNNTNAGPTPDPRGAWKRFTGSFRGERIVGRPLPAPRKTLERVDALALEMALHEEAEKEALRGELAALEAAWREAEEIAGIADVLPDDPLDRLPDPNER